MLIWNNIFNRLLKNEYNSEKLIKIAKKMIKNIKFNISLSKKILLTKDNVNYSLKIMEDNKWLKQ